ncbi:MAG: hypothetical protein JWO38_1538, partial [Gemmataceae bacterium]|nr:hypothetical protein [Gemmataceae bacterium]
MCGGEAARPEFRGKWIATGMASPGERCFSSPLFDGLTGRGVLSKSARPEWIWDFSLKGWDSIAPGNALGGGTR